jgi:ABC-2 type transport system permease protein
VIGAIAARELTEYRRDSRTLALLGLIAALSIIGAVTGWAAYSKQHQQVSQSQIKDQETFLRQGAKPSHSAAHFGRLAFKPPAPLAVFDPGASPYLGQVIWLEAHRQDPAMFRPAEDAPELSRLADLSVAGVLTSLLPLLFFVIGAGSFAAERERQTLRQVMAVGPGAGVLFQGKLLAIAGVGVGAAFVGVAVPTAVAVMSQEASLAWDTMLRGTCLFAGFSAYACACAGIALLVSSRASSTTSALLILLTLWAVFVVIAPRVAASAAGRMHPTPDSETFWARISDATTANRLPRGSEELRLLEKGVIARAMQRELAAADLETLQVNRIALAQEVSEILGARAHSEVYANLHETHERQQQVRRWSSIVAPSVALMHWSSTISGTDIGAHRHYALAAERQRQLIVRKMNEDMMLNGAGLGYDYLASEDFWRTVPDFVYRPLSVSHALRAALPDGMALLAWSALALLAAWLSARRQRAI